MNGGLCILQDAVGRLDLRANLDRARHGGAQEEGRRLFYRLLNEEQAAETSEVLAR